MASGLQITLCSHKIHVFFYHFNKGIFEIQNSMEVQDEITEVQEEFILNKGLISLYHLAHL